MILKNELETNKKNVLISIALYVLTTATYLSIYGNYDKLLVLFQRVMHAVCCVTSSMLN